MQLLSAYYGYLTMRAVQRRSVLFDTTLLLPLESGHYQPCATTPSPAVAAPAVPSSTASTAATADSKAETKQPDATPISSPPAAAAYTQLHVSGEALAAPRTRALLLPEMDVFFSAKSKYLCALRLARSCPILTSLVSVDAAEDISGLNGTRKLDQLPPVGRLLSFPSINHQRFAKWSELIIALHSAVIRVPTAVGAECGRDGAGRQAQTCSVWY
jgi:hypothetical protein